jgi:nicotinamide mononucleotide transporter
MNYQLIIEYLAVFSALVYVIGISKGKMFSWYFAGFSSLLYIFLSINAKIYAESALHFFYFFTAIAGFYNWNNSSFEKKIIKMNIKNHLIFNASCIVLSFILFLFLVKFTDSKLPLIDSFTTVYSIFTTFLVINKVLENWIYWIIIDFVSIGLYYNRNLELSSLLYVAYIFIAIFGYFEWRKKMIKN